MVKSYIFMTGLIFWWNFWWTDWKSYYW